MQINANLASWKYEFIVIGALCAGWAVILFIFIPDSPYSTHWFTRAERLIIVSRKRDDQNGPDRRQCVYLLSWSSIPADRCNATIDGVPVRQ
jgi:hypothetical protein